MKKTFLMASALLALSAGFATAGGINLAWNDCGTNGLASRTFACNSNTGGATMFGSVIAPVPMPQLNGQASVLDVQTNQAALSNWWLTSCRPQIVTANFDFTGGPFNCLDPWAGVGTGSLAYTAGFGGPNKARIRPACARPGSYAMDNGTEHYIFKVTLSNSRSNGLGACAGCTDGACIVFNSVLLTQPLGVGNYTVSNPIVSQFVTHQAGGANVTSGCPLATPARTATWGSVKSLYR